MWTAEQARTALGDARANVLVHANEFVEKEIKEAVSDLKGEVRLDTDPLELNAAGLRVLESHLRQLGYEVEYESGSRNDSYLRIRWEAADKE